jgi:hypothetical protein
MDPGATIDTVVRRANTSVLHTVAGLVRNAPLPALIHLYGLIPLAVVAALIALAPTDPHDFWWHLRVGRIVSEAGVPRTNMFAWTVPPDQPFVYAAWLGDWLFYQMYLLCGLQGPVLARNILGTLAFALVLLEAWRRSGSWRLAGLAVFLAGMMTINNLTTRPQNWAWAPFAVYTIILGAYATKQVGWRALLALPPLMVFWVNAHGSFVLGLALLALYGIGEGTRALLRQPDAPDFRRLAALAAAALATLAATLVNPIGIDIFAYVVKLLTDPPSQGLVNEWQPPTVRSLAGSGVLSGDAVLLIAGLALGRRRLSLTDTLALVRVSLAGVERDAVCGLVRHAGDADAGAVSGASRAAQSLRNAVICSPQSSRLPWFLGSARCNHRSSRHSTCRTPTGVCSPMCPARR